MGSEIRDKPLLDLFGDIPASGDDELVTVHRRPPAQRAADNAGQTYEEANWAYLSPAYRAAHNRLRQARGLPTLAPPAVDYYKPPPPSVRPIDSGDNESVAAGRGFLGAPIMGPRGGEGFSIEGNEMTDADLARKARSVRHSGSAPPG